MISEVTEAGGSAGQRTEAPSRLQEVTRPLRLRLIALWVYIAVLTVLFSQPLAELLAAALGNDLHSYIPAVPLISGYLLYTRPRWAGGYRTSLAGAMLLAAIGAGALTAAARFGADLTANDGLSLMVLGYVSLTVAGGYLFLGSSWMISSAFPAAFLAFMIPLPDPAVVWLETALAAASADASAALFAWTGTPIFREGMLLTLPGITLHVARECSGIRSTVVLFITTVLASHLFLRGAWTRATLLAFVAPLAIMRNAVRILVIGLLCVHVGPHMIDSTIHHRGGPVFFALSLVPMALALWWLRRHDRGADTRG